MREGKGVEGARMETENLVYKNETTMGRDMYHMELRYGRPL